MEKGAVARGAVVVVACHAGTRKPGSVTGPADEAVMARPSAFPLLGVNMAAIGVETGGLERAAWCWSGMMSSVPLELDFLTLSHAITCGAPGVAINHRAQHSASTDSPGSV